LARIINPDGIGKERNQLVRSVVISLRELLQQPDTGKLSHDLAAFIAIALKAIDGTIDTSVEAWEKRGYWVKADRFRMDWAWTGSLGVKMRQAVLDEDWGAVAATAVKITEKLKNVDVPKRHRLGTPWTGAWEKLIAEEKSKSSA